MTRDTTHLVALQTRLSHERARLANAKTAKERELRAVWVAQAEKELAGELRFLGMSDTAPADIDDTDLLAALLE